MAQKRLSKKVSFATTNTQNLTKTQLEVLYYLTTEYLTPKQIGIRRQTTTQAVRKIIKKLQEKGVINRHWKKVSKNRPTRQPFINKIRLHGEEFNIKIIFKDHRYKELITKGNLMEVDGNTIRLYKNSIEVYSSKNFYGDTVAKADFNSSQYWKKFFTKLENKLKIIIVKEGYFNIRRVNQHFAEINNELAKDMEKKGDRLRIYDENDGKLWMTIDNSFNLHEMEFLHPKLAKEDAKNIIPFFKDLRENPVKLSDIMKIMYQAVDINKETAAGLNAVVQLLKPKEEDKPKEINKKLPEYIG